MTFEVLETLHEGRLSQVLRCNRRPDNGRVVLKRVPTAGLTPSSIARLRYEHRILTKLAAAHVPHVIRCLAWVDYEGSPAMVLEDLGGRAVGTYSRGVPWDVAEALQIGIHTARALQGLHRAGVVHKDINPSNLVYARAHDSLQLIDLGISSELPREVQVTDNVRSLEGTLAYMPPEQTGRLARSVDWRADLYSLGATLYELFAGRVPFQNDDLSRLLYAVVAEQPPPLQALAKVPPEVAQLVHRLLTKAPEDRYQSAHGVLHDLLLCAERLHSAQPQTWVLGAADHAERFALSEKLYGRAGALTTLEAQYSRAAAGECALMLVRGPSGIGKSALVQELQPAIARDAALFGLGKCDVLHRSVPFHVMREALGVLVRRLLMEPPVPLEAARRRVQEAVGNVGSALVALVPSLEALLGAQRPVPALGPQETENRLLMLFAAVFQTLARRHPLVLFFDDLQWADAGTFKLLTRLCTAESQGEKLLLVLAYRDNEVPPEHPLEAMLRGLMASGARPEVLTVAPLTVEDIAQMVGDATGTAPELTRPLAALVHSKTEGNAFFVRDMLQRLWTEGLLRINPDDGRWSWDAQAIAASSVSSAVADGMLGRWQALSEAAQQAVGAAACVGQVFTLQQVCLALEQPPHDVQRALSDTMRDGLLIPLSGQYRYESSESAALDIQYRFAHDKVQQAAALHTPEATRARWRHRLGNALAAAHARGEEVDLFALTSHWNAAQALVAAAGQSLEAARLNLQAATQALQISAPAKALECLRVGLTQLPADAWSSQYALRRDLETALAEAEFVAGNTPDAIARLDQVVAHERTALEKARTLRRRALLHSSHNLFAEAMRDAWAALRMLNYPVVDHATQAHIIREFIRLKLALRGKDIVSLGETPFTSDALWAEMLFVTEALGVSAVALDPLALAVMCLQVVRMVVQRGLVAASPHTFASMFPICAVMGDYAQAHLWRKALHRCMERTPESRAHGMAAFLSLAYVDHTVLRPAVYLERAQEISRLLLEEGQPVQATWPLMPQRLIAMLTDLDACNDLLAGHDELLRQHGRPDQRALHALLQEFTAWSQDREVAFAADLDTLRARLSDYPQISRTMFWSVVGTARWLDEDYDGALAVWRDGFHPQVFDNMDAVLVHVVFFGALSCTQHALLHGRGRPSEPKIFAKAAHKLKALARGAPGLFGGFVPLVAAELAALRGRHAEAVALYEDATRQLAGSGWTAMAGAASECAARHARRCAHHAAAAAHLQRALLQYRQWGHRRKVRLLEQAFSEYFNPNGPEAELMGVRRPSTGRTTHTKTRGRTRTGQGDAIDFPSLLAVSQALAEEGEVRAVASKILEFTVQNAAANRGVLLLDFKDGQGMQPFADTAKDPGPLPMQLVSLATRTLEPQLINDVARAPERGEGLRDGRVKAVLVAPLVHQGDCVGVLVLENHVITGAFTPERLTLLNVFASQAAVAVENARSRNQLERLVGERTTELQAAHARILRYERDAAEMQMAGGFAHEMRNALASAGYTADALFGETPGSLHLQTLEDLDALAQLCAAPNLEAERAALTALQATLRDSEDAREQMGVAVVTAVKRGHALTEQILRYAQAGTLRPGDDTVRATDLVGRVLQELKQGAASLPEDMQVDVPAHLVLPMKEEHAYIILRNLLKNAADALRDAPAPQPKRITIHGEVTPQSVLLAVEDTGGGMSDDVQKRIFQPFFSTKGAAGTGLGLGLSRKLAQVYGGDLRFSSEPPQGTRFELVLPRGGH